MDTERWTAAGKAPLTVFVFLAALLQFGCGRSDEDSAPVHAPSKAVPEAAPATLLEPAEEVGLEIGLAQRAALPSAGPTVGDGVVYEILAAELAESEATVWAAEAITNELVAGPLFALRQLALGPWSESSRGHGVSDVFADGARVPALTAEDWKEVPLAHGVVRREWVEPGALLALDDWQAALDSLHAGTRRVRWTRWKPALVRRTDAGAYCELLVEWNRELPAGGLEHLSARWRTHWVVSDEGQWRCRAAEVAPGASTLVSQAPHWVDSTAAAFAGTALDPSLPGTRDGSSRGLALADLDGDGDSDLVVSRPAGLFYNRGDGTFEDRSARLHRRARGASDGAALWNDGSRLYGVLAADFDRDGDMDLLFGVKRTPCLLLRQVDGEFWPEEVEASHSLGIPTSLSAHDVDVDGWLDVFVAHYGPFAQPGPNNPAGADNGKPNQMLRGLPGGLFEDVTERWGFSVQANRWSFIGAFGDADLDGDVDLYCANDFGPNVLYRRSDGADVHFEAVLETEELTSTGFSMSATFTDLDGDALPDLYVSNMSSTAAGRVLDMASGVGDPAMVALNDVRREMSKGNTILLQRDGRLVEGTAERGAKRGSWAWGTALVDYDADGDVDIHCLNGYYSRGDDDGRDL